jgi:hypothetical protein
MKNSTYSRRSQIVSTVKQVARHNACRRVLAKERPPGRCRPPRRGIEPVAAQRAADRGCRDPHAEPLELALLRWSPQRGFSLAKRTISCCSSWSRGGRPGRRCGEVQLPATSRRCQRSSVCGVTKNHDQRVPGKTRLMAASNTRSIGSSLERGFGGGARPVAGAGQGSPGPWRHRCGQAARAAGSSGTGSERRTSAARSGPPSRQRRGHPTLTTPDTNRQLTGSIRVCAPNGWRSRDAGSALCCAIVTRSSAAGSATSSARTVPRCS